VFCHWVLFAILSAWLFNEPNELLPSHVQGWENWGSESLSNLSEVLQLVDGTLKFSSGTQGLCGLGLAGWLAGWPPLPRISFIHCASAAWACFDISNLPNWFLPQGLCACCFVCLESAILSCILVIHPDLISCHPRETCDLQKVLKVALHSQLVSCPFVFRVIPLHTAQCAYCTYRVLWNVIPWQQGNFI
jgi:hypothetical protein